MWQDFREDTGTNAEVPEEMAALLWYPCRREAEILMRRSPMKRSGKPMKRSGVSKTAKAKRYQVLRAESIWSQAVRDRDDHRCRRCGKRDEKNNHAHHVAPRSRRPDLKSDKNNGITVCPDCHNWIHSHPVEAEALGLLSSETYEKSRRESIINSALA